MDRQVVDTSFMDPGIVYWREKKLLDWLREEKNNQCWLTLAMLAYPLWL